MMKRYLKVEVSISEDPESPIYLGAGRKTFGEIKESLDIVLTEVRRLKIHPWIVSLLLSVKEAIEGETTQGDQHD